MIFKNMEKLVENVAGVTEYLTEAIKARGGNPRRETLQVIRTKDGQNYYKLFKIGLKCT